MTRRCTQIPRGTAAACADTLRGAIPVLETERLRLRAPTLADLPHWTAWWQGHDPNESEEDAWNDFCVYNAGWVLHGHGMWTIETKAEARVVGFTLLGLEWDDEEPEIGSILAPDARGQGFATEAGRAVQAIAFDHFGRGGAVSYISPKNAASAAVAKRLGAKREGDMGSSQIWRHGVSA